MWEILNNKLTNQRAIKKEYRVPLQRKSKSTSCTRGHKGE